MSPSATVDTVPSISVVVNNYNYAEYLVECIDSALCQLGEADELVVIDDGSTDNSHAVLESYRSTPGVRLVMQENGGQVAALLRGFEEAACDVVAFLDSDDSYTPGYLERLRTIYSENEKVNFVASHPEVQADDEGAGEGTRVMLRRMMFPTGTIGATRWATRCFSEFVGVPTSGISMRLPLGRELVPVLDTLRVFEHENSLVSRIFRLFGVSLPVSQFGADGLLVRHASLLGAIKYYDGQPGFNYRIHASNRFGRLPYWKRYYQRHARVRALTHKLDELGYPDRPTTNELLQEFSERLFPISFRRRSLLKLRYAWVVPGTRGTLLEKLRALWLLPWAGKKPGA